MERAHNTKSLKLFPEQYPNFHYKNSSFDLPPTSSHQNRRVYNKFHDLHERIHPIYVHKFHQQPPIPPPMPQYLPHEGDFTIIKEKPIKTSKTKHVSSVIDKLEEAYWANWKPTKSKDKKQEITVIKEPPKPKSRAKNSNKSTKNTVDNRKSQEVQTEIIEKLLDNVHIVKEQETIENKQPVAVKLEIIETKFLKHTDSIIITKNRNKSKERVEQPKTIKLTKKPKHYIKGGSYPLKSSTKTQSTPTNRGSIRLGRPGSPLIVSKTNKNRK